MTIIRTKLATCNIWLRLQNILRLILLYFFYFPHMHIFFVLTETPPGFWFHLQWAWNKTSPPQKKQNIITIVSKITSFIKPCTSLIKREKLSQQNYIGLGCHKTKANDINGDTQIRSSIENRSISKKRYQQVSTTVTLLVFCLQKLPAPSLYRSRGEDPCFVEIQNNVCCLIQMIQK